MKRMIPAVIVGLFIATTAFAQNNPETNPVKKDNPVFTDTVPNNRQMPPDQTQTEDTTHNPWVTEPEKRQNQEPRTDTTFPERMDTSRNQKQYQRMDTTNQQDRDTSKPWVNHHQRKNKMHQRRNRNYPEKRDTSMQHHMQNKPERRRQMNQRTENNTPPLQHTNNPPMTDTSSGK